MKLKDILSVEQLAMVEVLELDNYKHSTNSEFWIIMKKDDRSFMIHPDGEIQECRTR